jgi:hypothetical protein
MKAKRLGACKINLQVLQNPQPYIEVVVEVVVEFELLANNCFISFSTFS